MINSVILICAINLRFLMAVELRGPDLSLGIEPAPEIKRRNIKAELRDSALFRSFKGSGSYDKHVLTSCIIPFIPNEGFKYFGSAQKINQISPSFKSFYQESLKDLVSRKDCEKMLGEELVEVIEGNYHSCWQEFIPHLRSVSHPWLIKALQVAAQKNNLDAVRMIVSLFSQEKRGEMLEDASRGGNLGLVNVLLAVIDMIPKDALVWACKEAAERGHCNIVQVFLPFAAYFPEWDDFGEALEYAAREGRVDVLQVLLKQTGLFRDFQRAFEKAFSAAAYSGQISAIKTLFTVLPEIIDARSFGTGLNHAAGNENGSLALILGRCNHRILQESFEEALEIASKEGFVNHVAMFLSCGREISSSGLKKALEKAEKDLRLERVLNLTGGERYLQIIQLLTARLEKTNQANSFYQ